MKRIYHRRELLRLSGGALLASALDRPGSFVSANSVQQEEKNGCIVGHPLAARVGAEVLASGGNAIDAAVAAALVAGVVAVRSCGIGGYGGHMVIALAGKKVRAIDFNSAAPAAAREDMFPLDENGQVKGRINLRGWLAAGVPGTLAGMQLALDRYGTRRFRELVQPAIRYAREGFEIDAPFEAAIRNAQVELIKDEASARLLLNKGEPLRAGSTFRNPDLAAMLETLGGQYSVDASYRGDIGRNIADAFRKHGGLVTARDMATYYAREVDPLEFKWRGYSIHTAPLTAGGLTVFEALSILKAMGWEKLTAGDPKTTQARLETLRLAWDDRLKLLGDPERVNVPIEQLLSESHAGRMAARVEASLKSGKAVRAGDDRRTAAGTIHLSAADAQGNMVALTLTHGESFGAQVTVDGLGLILGHGMSRFDPRPGRPNSPGPGKRPLHNMCPTVVLREGKAVLALGGAGGRRIPNAVFEMLAQYAGRDASMKDALAAPRIHTEGGMSVGISTQLSSAEMGHLKKIGYTVKTEASATLHAVSFDPVSGACTAASG